MIAFSRWFLLKHLFLDEWSPSQNIVQNQKKIIHTDTSVWNKIEQQHE